MVLCPDVAPYSDSRFDCRDLLQRSVIHYGAERKASSAIISTPIQGVTTGTVASISRGPSVDARDKMLHGIDTPTAGSPRSSPALLTRSSHQGPHNSACRPPVQGMSQVSFLFP